MLHIYKHSYIYSIWWGVLRYKQAGNAVPPPLARALGVSLRRAAAAAASENGSAGALAAHGGALD